MTETEWKNCTDPQVMLDWLGEQGRLSDRKLRLFAVACCRRVLHLLDETHRAAANMVEEWADTKKRGGLHGARRLWRESGAHFQAEPSRAFPLGPVAYCRANARERASSAVWEAARPKASMAATAHLAVARAFAWWEMADEVEKGLIKHLHYVGFSVREAEAQTSILRCLFGNPFRPPPTFPASMLSWNSGTAVQLANAIYEQRRWDEMPVLADALEEAGCRDEEVLAHCRGPGKPSRGCHVVDLLLNRG